ncbi:MAG: hypothetical protein MZV64_13240 [Ignavibacteriales bacterium]|nr:hypothetical protein [Ignavibacteriales bacterium]
MSLSPRAPRCPSLFSALSGRLDPGLQRRGQATDPDHGRERPAHHPEPERGVERAMRPPRPGRPVLPDGRPGRRRARPRRLVGRRSAPRLRRLEDPDAAR